MDFGASYLSEKKLQSNPFLRAPPMSLFYIRLTSSCRFNPLLNYDVKLVRDGDCVPACVCIECTCVLLPTLNLLLTQT